MTPPIPNALTQFIDNRGNPLSNGSVSYFLPGTTTPKQTWRDPGLTIPNANPVVLDANGRAPIFGTGRYRQQVRTSNNTLLFDAETALPEANLPLATEISGLTIDPDIQGIETRGFAVTGKGAARYARQSVAPPADEQSAGLGRWLLRSNANSVWWRLAEPTPTDFMFGVLADASVTANGGVLTVSGTDDTAALQAAIDYVIYFSTGGSRRLYMPNGRRRITGTLQLGYGDRYVDWQIEGDAARGWDANLGYHSGIYADFNDRPAFNIQGARSCRISSISVYGLNHGWMAQNEQAITNRALIDNWRGGQMQPATVNTRYAPYCGIAVDGYTGVRQAVSSYPDLIYPAWLAGMPQYGKPSSSMVEFRDVSASGFEVGIAVQPNLQANGSNGEFIHWIGCDLGANLVGASLSHSDARAITFERCRFQGCHTAFDSLAYGTGQGNIAAVFSSCTFDRSYRIFNMDLGITAQPFAPTATLINAYAEALYTIGTVRSAAATGRPGSIQFLGGELGFSLRPGEQSPATYLVGRGEVRATFQDVSLIGTYGVFPIDCELARFEAVIPAVAQFVFDQATVAGRRAANALCGVDAPRLGEISVRPFTVYTNNGAAFFNQRCRSHGWDFTLGGQAAATIPVPLFVRSVDFDGFQAPIASSPQEVVNRAITPLTNVTKSGIEWSFSVAGSFLSDPANPACCIGQGDIVRDEDSGLLYYAKSVAFNGSGASLVLDMVLRQLTGVRSSDGITWTTTSTLAPDTGILRLRNARRFLPAIRRRLAMASTGGSGTVTMTAMGSETIAESDFGTTNGALAVGDFLVPSYRGATTLDDSTFAKGRITGLNLSVGQVTFDTQARRGGLWAAPLFIKGT